MSTAMPPESPRLPDWMPGKINATSPPPSPGGAAAPPCQIQWRIFFAWYDACVGIYMNRAKRRVYVLPLPCCGICFGRGEKWERGTFGNQPARRHWFTGKVYLTAAPPPYAEWRYDAAKCWSRTAVEHPEKFEPNLRALERHERETIRTGGGPMQRKVNHETETNTRGDGRGPSQAGKGTGRN